MDLPILSPTDLALYYFPECPFCRRVTGFLKEKGLDIELRNIHENQEYLRELVSGGGSKTVPCLRMKMSESQYHWLYESVDIINYLKKING